MDRIHTLEEISTNGAKIYADLRESLEKEHMGEYVVIDVDNGKYVTDPDRLAAVEKAKKDFGDKLFYIVQIGSTQTSNTNFSSNTYAWNF